MFVIKRDGSKVHVRFDEISARIRSLCHERGLTTIETEGDGGEINVELLADRTITSLPHEKDRILRTSQIDALSADIAEFMCIEHGNAYHLLAGYLLMSNLHKETPKSFSEATKRLAATTKGRYLADSYVAFVTEHAEYLDQLVDHSRDYMYDYFAIQTLRKGYLLQDEQKKTIERPQYMHMRVAVALGRGNLAVIAENYRLFSEQYYTHASPTLFNAGKPKGALSSCYLITIPEDSIEGIYGSLYDAAMISKASGGIGVCISKIRAVGAMISSSRGTGDGVGPMLEVWDKTAKYVNQSGARKGAISIYIEPWHADIFHFLELKSNEGDESSKTRNLFQGLWVPDLFMERVEAQQNWSLFSPDDTPDLVHLWGPAFRKRYLEYEEQGKAKKVVPAMTLWWAILKAQIETGGPYMLYKDAANAKSNQQNLGTITCSNLCTEIIEYSGPGEIANCNLASISLPKFVNVETKTFDFKLLAQTARAVVNNLNTVIDETVYPVDKCKVSNLQHRPLGIGVQGLADVFLMLRLPYTSVGAQKLNVDIFKVLYYAAMDASCDLARQDGAYSSFPGSPTDHGLLQPDMWDVKTPDEPELGVYWSRLRLKIAEHGLRNSLLLAPMPTATTSSIMNNIESFEPLTTNLYVRKTQTGEYCLLNKHLVKILQDAKLWKPEIFNQLKLDKGSVRNIHQLPPDIRECFKTCWELKLPVLIDMAAARGAYICQSQSFNCFMGDPSYSKLTAYHYYAWRAKLKTGMYYLRSKAAFDAVNFSVTPPGSQESSSQAVAAAAAGPSCASCSS